ncbi:hypothetical protein A3D03_00435 [Candidatus Gottesmanbacteria bacterium RIFCSPHIGHO2_02_FULL_40_13]|uniref:Uncharacterized protein n=1 Tax=Candidatus Gottesmanbacteria bacterium RIFCSPHIGHO2_02_FULL_40_13 TaxID=1798384 RepID=A0A1F6ACJ1_9BACT|nr:MAG: hypothetical protein A3D03_00435 [Candidatus Gottesmanbacteria bacterium RIFCSPHIGHO2_02_FULL_40_13]
MLPITIQLGTTFEFKPEANDNSGNHVVINPKHLGEEGFTFSKLETNPKGEHVISPMTGSDQYDSIYRKTGQLTPEEVAAALRRGEVESGWEFDETTIQMAKAGGSKEIF